MIHIVHLFQGICFIRTSRPDTAVLYSPEEKFEVGVAKVLMSTTTTDAKLGSSELKWLSFTRWCVSLTMTV